MSQDVSNIRAEVLLPIVLDNWEEYSVRKAGLFFKGYMPDVLSIEPGTRTVELSRDGLMQMLPEAMFFREEYLRENIADEDALKEKIEMLKMQHQQMSIFFKAFDTCFARQEMHLHHILEDAECNGEEIILREMYGVDLSKERDPNVRKLAQLLLIGPEIKGNIGLLAFCVGGILDVGITYDVQPNVVDDCKSAKYTVVRFNLYIDGLTSVEYMQRMERYEEFFFRLEQWFLPYDCEVDYCIKGLHQRFILGESLTLDYNTRFEMV